MDDVALAVLQAGNMDAYERGVRDGTASKWQPIETAPKDGTRIIVYRPKHDGNYIPKVGTDHWGIFGMTPSWAHSRSDTPPTHWQPMPDPPPKEKRR